MRSAWMVLGLVGCGRIAFDARSDAGAVDGADAPSTITLPPQVCSATTTMLPALASNVDLVVTSLTAGGFAAAWVETPTPSAPIFVRFDAQRGLVAGPNQVVGTGNTGDNAYALIDLDTRLYLTLGAGTLARQLAVGYDLVTIPYQASFNSPALPRDCVQRDSNRTRTLWATGSGTMLSLAYLNVDGPGTMTPFDTGVTLDRLACQDGPDHTHVGWSAVDGSCSGTNIAFGAMPTPGAISPISPDCTGLRAATIDYPSDTSGLIWRTSAGAIESAYVVSAPSGSETVTPSGRAPRVASDGTRAWYAWIDTRLGRDELRIGHRTDTGALTEAAIEGLLPAGDEAFEMVRVGTTVHLVVLSRDGAVRFLELCP